MSGSAGSGSKAEASTSVSVSRRDLQLILRELHGRRAGATLSLSTNMMRCFRRLSVRAWASEGEALEPSPGGREL